MILLTFHEKYGTVNYVCYTSSDLCIKLFHVMMERYNDGWYFDDRDAVTKIIELKKNNDSSWVKETIEFMMSQSDNEYEGFEISYPEVVKNEVDLSEFIPKRYRF